jgi:hypothetical protein
VYQWVYPPPHQLLKQLVDLYKIELGDHAIEGDLDAIISNVVAATIPKWRMFNLVRWIQNWHQSTQDHEILNCGRSSEDEKLLLTSTLQETKKIRTWRQVEF